MSALLLRLAATDGGAAALVLRLALGAVMLPHGLQHGLGLLGGTGPAGTMKWFQETSGIPRPLMALGILAESVGALLLLAGLGGRLAALAIGVTLAVAAATHRANGFFMNWLGNQQGEGFEYHLLGIAMAAALVVLGSGRASVDAWLAGR